MENKINISKLLYNCPKGMELDCTTWENVTFDKVVDDNIYIKRNNKTTPFGNIVVLNKYGCTTNHEDEKCRIFPKGKTTWEGFHRPFVEGDIIYVDDFIAILSNITESGIVWYHCYCCTNPKIFRAQRDFGIGNIKDGGFRLATEEEKQKLFDAIKANGYRWNAETKTLEKLVTVFKVGDRIRHKENGINCTLGEYSEGISAYRTNIGLALTSKDLGQWELAPNKFDINTLKPFNKVLVRTDNKHVWSIQFFERLNNRLKDSFVCMGGWRYRQCIPFEGNEHLLNTVNDCDDFFKVWENS